ncbi:MAG TPA: hypothetical protein VEI46_09055 [Thermodesulfovibrionales bacterium]|nr:hypothetical protein [Thermodesulfovibrionales bacterium]
MEKNRILITCAKGITPFLKEELLQQGFPVLSEGVAGVTTEGTLDDTLRLNLLLRTGHRVLYLLREFPASNAESLYRGVSQVPWEKYIAEDGYVCVTSSVADPFIRDSRYANVKCKDAIVDRIREKCGQRPDSGADQHRAVVNLYCKNGDCSLYLDTSGEPLSRRGYRRIPMGAPMQETLAAAVIMATGWRGNGHFINPMCGSGTLAIEAALTALNRPAGLLRDNFGFIHLKGFREAFWNNLRAQAKKEAKKSLDSRIIAADIRKGLKGYLFTGNLDLAKKVGLKAKRRIPFFNGGIECRLFEYELYAGSRKKKNPQIT